MKVFKHIVIFLFYLLICKPTIASDVLELFVDAGELMNKDQFDKALPIFNDVAGKFLEQGNQIYYLYTLCYSSICSYGLSDYYQMNETAISALDSFEYWKISDSLVLPSINFFIGQSYYELGNTSQAFHYLKKSFQQNQMFGSLMVKNEDLLNNLAVCYLDFADYEKVRLYANRAAQSENPAINDGNRAQWNNLIAKSYQYQKDFENAGLYYQKAISNLEDIKKLSSKSYTLIILNNYASFLISIGDLDNAKAVIREIEEYGLDKANDINYRQNIAKHALYSGQEQNALELFNEVIDTAIHYYGRHHMDVIETYLDIAEVYHDKKKYSEASSFADLSLDANSFDHVNEDLKSYQQFIIPKLALKALLLKTKGESHSTYEKAALNIPQILKLLDHIIESDISIFESKLHMVEYVRSYFKELIDITLDNNDLDQAYYLCQKSHGLILDLQVDDNELKSSILDPKLYIRDKQYRQEISGLKSELSSLTDNSDSISRSQLNGNLFQLQYDYDQFNDSLLASYPQLELTPSDSDFGLDQLRSKLLDDKSVLVEYFLTTSELYIFHVSADSIFVKRNNLPDDFVALVDTLLMCTTSLSNNSFGKFTQAAHRLYEILLEPVLAEHNEELNRLFIISDGLLNYIPFDALIEFIPPQIANNRYDLLPYLVKSYEINYNYSSLLYQSNKSPTSQHLSGFAPAFNQLGEDEQGLVPLLHNVEELLIIDDIIGGQMFIDSSARLDNFLESANSYNIAHLATHAVCNDSLPMRSKIYFHDDILSTYEIYNMPNSLDLVVLSACNTGSGQLKKGEGIMSLARAFMASGCSSIITSLWNVNDQVSLKLMTQFYKELADNKPVGYSLRSAKLNYLNNVQSIMDAHPYYWSGFVLVGDDFEFSTNSLPYTIIVFIVFILFVIGYFLFSKD